MPTKGLGFESIAVDLGGRRVLDNVSGGVRVGDFLVVLGPSGSGKTLLLSVLCGEAKALPGSKISLAGRLGYAPQFDRLLPFVTVEETLWFGLQLRCTERDFERADRVGELLSLFDLSGIRESVVGSTERRGISGGERKKLGLATELISSPDVLLCDEPTTGLDAVSALAMVKVLAEVSSWTAVCATVHQPSSRLYGLFQHVMVLTKGGSVLYCGEAKKAAATVDGLWRSRGQSPPGSELPAAEFVLEAAFEAQGELAEAAKAVSSVPLFIQDEQEAQPVVGHKLVPLLKRAIVANRRSPAATRAAMGRSIAMGLVVGLFYSGGRRDDQNGVADRTGALFFIAVNQGYSAIGSIRIFLEERVVFEHEHRRGAYAVLPYFLAKTIAELPYQALFALVFGSLAYYFAGLRRDPVAAAAHFGILALATLVAESLALAVGAASPDAKTAVALGPALLSVSLLFAGFLVKLDSLSPMIALLQHASLFRQAFAALLKIEFGIDGLRFLCSVDDKTRLAETLLQAGLPARLIRGNLIDSLPCPVPDARTHLNRTLGADIADQPIARAELPSLLVLFCAFRVLAFWALKWRASRPSRPDASIYDKHNASTATPKTSLSPRVPIARRLSPRGNRIASTSSPSWWSFSNAAEPSSSWHED